jgi:NADH-quinone oxidoreductase subunit H
VIFNVICVAVFLAKMFALLLVFIWVRTTLPRLRADQLMRFAWLYLIPLTLVNILLTGALLLLPFATPLRVGISAAVNWLLLLFVIFSFRRVVGLTSKGKLPKWVTPAKGPVAVSHPVESPTAAASPQPPELAAGPAHK